MKRPVWLVEDVKPQRDYTLLITFADGSRRLYDARPLLEKELYAMLKNPAFFLRARAEYGTVEFRADDAVRTRREVRQFVFFHARRVRRDRRAFDADAEPLDRFGRVVGYLVVGFVAFC